MILILIYTGVRISELLDLKKENVYLEKQYFEVIKSKTESGIRKVPIGNLVYPFLKNWYDTSQCDYIFHTPEQNHFQYRNYYDSYFNPIIERFGYNQTPSHVFHF